MIFKLTAEEFRLVLCALDDHARFAAFMARGREDEAAVHLRTRSAECRRLWVRLRTDAQTQGETDHG